MARTNLIGVVLVMLTCVLLLSPAASAQQASGIAGLAARGLHRGVPDRGVLPQLGGQLPGDR